MHHALEGGGKRLRPRLAWESYAYYAGPDADWEKALPLLEAVELLHTFTLVHDDVMDRAELRRGRPTLYQATDENTAILIGDALLIAVYERLAALPAERLPLIQRILSQAALRVCHGQLQDLHLAQQPTEAVSLEDYLAMITEKTGALLGAALESGAALAGAPPEELQALRRAGEALGRFFQVQDDYLDAFSPHTGKALGGDIAEGKKTFLWLWAWAEASPVERQALLTADPSHRRTLGLALYERLGLRERGAAFVEEFYKEVEKAADSVGLGKELKAFARSLLARQR